jgi:hypothetical protein
MEIQRNGWQYPMMRFARMQRKIELRGDGTNPPSTAPATAMRKTIAGAYLPFGGGLRGRCLAEMDLMMICRRFLASSGTFARCSARFIRL